MSSDIIAEILRKVDGSTLAIAASSSSGLMSIAFQEWLWENLCSSLWPSTQKEEVKQLISSLGGFRTFYGYCFPLLNVCCKHSILNFKKDYHEIFSVGVEYSGEEVVVVVDDDVPVSSSKDLVSLVDIHYNNKSIYSKVISEEGMSHFHCRSSSLFPLSPFLIDLLCNCDGAIPSISIKVVHDREKDVDSKKIALLKMMKLSWILINTRTKRAVNLSSWKPLEVRRTFWGRENDFTVRFGSILPARYDSPLEIIACNITVSCRVVDHGYETMNLQINEITVRLEDVLGYEVNEREGFFAIDRAMKWGKRSKRHDDIIEACRQMLEIQNEYIMEEKVQAIRRRMTPLHLLLLFAALALSYYYCFI
ncbi:hypothetical protein KI387_040594 [Taxus chinensis]|uniref:SRCR domain-containing protein n=1 Tax=Taxus chinensis TaxID=29808 RepID=A0AA38C3D1_TAXCH|nr:hypothetical protein KI387_040594 [Taxus chinensis]